MSVRSELHSLIDSLPDVDLNRAKAAVLAAMHSSSVDRDIRSICDKLSKDKRIEKIFLFGSRANGIPRDDSDIDLYLVLSDSAESVISVIQDARISILGMSDHSVDIIASTLSDFGARSTMPVLEREVLERGVVMYERSVE